MRELSLTGRAAVALAERDVAVFPCFWPLGSTRCACGKPNCPDIGKHPIGSAVPHGCTDASAEPERVAEWFARFPLANVAIACGAKSGVIGLDVDPRKGGAAAWDDLEAKHERFPYSIRARSGSGGWHLYLRHPGARVSNDSRGRLGPGIDVRGDGGYLIAPPSMHRSGERYIWLDVDSSKLEDVPEWLLRLLPRYAAAGSTPADDGPVLSIPAGEQVFGELHGEAVRRISEGVSRHNTLVWLFGQARDNRIPSVVCDAALDDLEKLCNVGGERLVTEKEIRAMLGWAYKRPPREPFRHVAKILEAESKGQGAAS